jgi:hypothetical protein
MTRFSLSNGLLIIGGVLTTLAIFWWWVVFDELLKTNTMTFADVLPCLARNTDLCSLAESLCRQDHFLGIRRYSAEAFWGAGAVLLVAVVLRSLRAGQARP